MAITETVFQPRELVLLLIVWAGMIPVLIAYQRRKSRLFLIAYAAVAISAGATVVEAVIRPTLLNLVEHMAIVVASGMFFYTAYRSNAKLKDVNPEEVV